MKRYPIALALGLALTVSSVFAYGPGSGFMAVPGSQALNGFEAVKLSGTLSQEVGKPVLFNAAGQVYVVRLPFGALSGIKISQGESVSLEGYTIDAAGNAAGYAALAGSKILLVNKAVIQGKEYVFAVGPGSAMMMNRQAGMDFGQKSWHKGRMQNYGSSRFGERGRW